MIPYTLHTMTSDDVAAVRVALTSGWIAGGGPYTESLEAKLCEVSGAAYAVVVNSGTAALHLAYLATGVGPGKTVLTSPVTFVATANAALHCGADVGFYDWYTLDVPYSKTEEPDVSMFVPVTLGGDPNSDMWGGFVLDSCQGPITHPLEFQATCISLHPAKFATAGEGGAVLTNDKYIDYMCRSLRDHGRIKRQDEITWHEICQDVAPRSWMECAYLGFNYRMPDINAALALSQLERYHDNVADRRRIAAIYDAELGNKVETVPHSGESARHLYQILHNERDRVRAELAKRGVGSQVHYEPIVPLQSYYRDRFGYKPGTWPNAERYAARTLSVPLYPTLTEGEIEHVIKSICEVV